MKQSIFFIFLLFGGSLFSQNIVLRHSTNPLTTSFDEKKKELYIFYKDSLSIIRIPDLTEIRKIKLNDTDQILKKRFIPISTGEGVFFVENLGGKIYKLMDGDFIRIDQSYTHKMQIGSSIIVHKNIIYRYGGYGFWSQRNFFTYFDMDVKEWDILVPSGSKIFPQGSEFSTVKTYKDNFYIYGGLSLIPNDPKSHIYNNEVWKFDIKNRLWELLGRSKVDLSNLGKFNDNNSTISYKDKHVFFSKSHVYLVDVINNKLDVYKNSSFQDKINSRYKSFYSNGVFYLFTNRFNSNNPIELVTRNEDEFFGEFVKKTSFYSNNNYLFYILVTVLLISGILLSSYFIRKWYLNKNKIIVSKEKIIFKGNLLMFNEKSIKILNLLLRSEEDVFSNEIMDITENKSHNYAHNTRVKNQLVDEINFHIKSLFSSEENVITVRKSELDKRIKVYQINKDRFFLK